MKDDIVLVIKSGGYYQQPILAGDITWKTERKGSPGELTFTCIKDSKLSFPEGAEVKLEVNGKGVFHGFVFTKSRDKQHHIKVTAYDQLRYLKNKDTLIYSGWTCTKLLKYIATVFQLNLAEDNPDTGYAVGTDENPRVEENSTLFDMLLNNLDETVLNTGNLYVLYDDCGHIRLKNIEDMKVEYLITESAGENFDYQSSIDGEVYNKVKLYIENEDTGNREFYIAQDAKNISKWGVLQYHGKVESEQEVINTTKAVMELYNHRQCNLTVKGLIGDINVRAGCLLPVDLNLGDDVGHVGHFLMAESVTHKWSKGHHSMDVTLSGSVNEGDSSFVA